MQKCRITNDDLTQIFDFGNHPLGNGFLDKSQFADEYFYNMQVGFSDKSKMFQLLKQPEPEKMFHENYAFFSSTSKYMKDHFKKFYEEVLSSDYNINHKDTVVVEIGCNDGILINNFSA